MTDRLAAEAPKLFLQNVPDDAILFIPEICEVAGKTEATWRWYRHVKRGPRSFKVGRRIAYRAADVRQWLEDQYADAS